MSINRGTGASDDLEFSCLGCGSVLKIPASAAGRAARCPKCGSVQQTAGSAAGLTQGPAENGPASMSESSSTSPGTSMPMPSASAPPAAAQPPSVLVPASAAAITPPPSIAAASTSPFRAAAPPATGAGLSPSKLTAGRARIENETATKRLFDRVMAEIAKIYVGQDELVLGTLVALFSNGHVLIESVPGLGKTLFVRSLGRVLGCRFGRIQFTADLMPSDITGAPIFDLKNQEFRFRPGPVFTQLLLAD